MAPSDIPDLDFALICLKLYGTNKPDFAAVANATGCMTKNQAYHRHYSLMKKVPDPNVGSSSATINTPKTPAKRGRKATEAATDDIEDGSAVDAATPDTPSKKPKVTKKAKGKGKAKAEPEAELDIKTEDAEDDEDTQGNDSTINE